MGPTVDAVRSATPGADLDPDRDAGPRRRPGRPGPGIRTTLTVALATLGAAAIGLGDLVGLDRVLPFTVFVALRPPLAVLGVVVAPGALAVRTVRAVRARRRGRTAPRRWWPVGGPVLVVALVMLVLVAPRATAGAAPPTGGTPLRLLEFNVYEGRADPAALAAVIVRERPDLVVLPEAGPAFLARLAPRVPGYRGWSTAPPGAADVRGIVILASPRAGDVTPRRLDEPTRYPWAEVTGGVLGRVRLVAVHLVSPVPRWVGFWPGELEDLRTWCAGPAPALVVGDLNASADHSPFRAGTAGCSDAAAERGVGLVPTWRSGWPPGVGPAIDHVLMRDGPQAASVEVLDLPGSDHRALLVTLRL